ncbi:MAG: type II toxin-antitoxin system VapC family toxin [Planctomycetia bacterium]|nr:type II toxin-antitoxin system VapC family toxin [Planctomycetia bacterium]
MDAALLDTDILNEVLKQKNANVVRHAAAYLAQHGQFAISSITRYELLRGLKEKNASSQLARFQAFCQQTTIFPVADDILDRAVDLWVAGRTQGLAPKDADVIIAATALHHGRVLVTGNLAHFAWIPGLTINNWRNP